MGEKKIIVGHITENIHGTPLEKFQEVIRLSKNNDFTVYTNDPLVVEAFEVICGEDNINVFFNKKDNMLEEITCMDAYNYVGDIYGIINSVRFCMELDDDLDGGLIDYYNLLDENIKEYKDKYGELI